MSTITVTGIPATKTAPRGALWAARAATSLWAGLTRWIAAGREPALALEAAQVRALARRHAATDPGFAADLMAAADRHEAQHADR